MRGPPESCRCSVHVGPRQRHAHQSQLFPARPDASRHDRRLFMGGVARLEAHRACRAGRHRSRALSSAAPARSIGYLHAGREPSKSQRAGRPCGRRDRLRRGVHPVRVFDLSLDSSICRLASPRFWRSLLLPSCPDAAPRRPGAVIRRATRAVSIAGPLPG
jgi:hypothetical protein